MNVFKYLDDAKIIYHNNKLDIINFNEIILLSNTKIILKFKHELIISGDNLLVLKLMDKEILIEGLINKVEIG